MAVRSFAAGAISSMLALRRCCALPRWMPERRLPAIAALRAMLSSSPLPEASSEESLASLSPACPRPSSASLSSALSPWPLREGERCPPLGALFLWTTCGQHNTEMNVGAMEGRRGHVHRSGVEACGESDRTVHIIPKPAHTRGGSDATTRGLMQFARARASTQSNLTTEVRSPLIADTTSWPTKPLDFASFAVVASRCWRRLFRSSIWSLASARATLRST